jgi:hypothetical protein
MHEIIEHMREHGGASLHELNLYASPSAFAQLRSIDTRTGAVVFKISVGHRAHSAFHFPSLLRYFASWGDDRDLGTESGDLAGYIKSIDVSRESAHVTATIKDRNTLEKLRAGTLTGAAIPLRVVGKRGDLLSVAPRDAMPRVTDRPVAAASTFCRIEANGDLRKAVRFANIVRGRPSGDPTIDLLKAIHAMGAQPLTADTLAKADAAPAPDLPPDVEAIKRDLSQRR